MKKSNKAKRPMVSTAMGRQRPDARFPTTPTKVSLPDDYADALRAVKHRIQEERLLVVLSANAAMVRLYRDIGQMILERQDRAAGERR
jgi:hypothetical protein